MSNYLKSTIEETLEKFCQEFMDQPYLCYTEHGLHALFYSRLHTTLSACNRCYCNFKGEKVCVIQKEYPTEGQVGKSRRQNWDIAVIATNNQKGSGSGSKKAWEKYKPEIIKEKDWLNLQTSKSTRYHEYDAFKLLAVIEFGMNEGKEHLVDDIDRLSEAKHITNKYIVHLYRTAARKLLSSRDISPKNNKFIDEIKFYKLPEIKKVKSKIKFYYKHYLPIKKCP